MNKSMTLPALLATTIAASVSGAAYADICEFKDENNGTEISIFATNSIRLGTDVIVTGNVVANNASPGPVLDEGVELALDRNAKIYGNATAVSADLDNGAAVVLPGVLTTGVTPPVFAAGDIPMFRAAEVQPEAQDLIVTAGGNPVVLGRSLANYGDIVIEQGGTLIFEGGGRFDVRSITSTPTAGQCDPCRTIEFTAPTELRIEGRFDSERGSYIGPAAGTGIAASDITIYVGGQNGASGGLFETPRAANPGRDSEVHASFYVPNGTFELEKDSTMIGAVLAADVQIDKNTEFTGDSAFHNKPPAVDDKFAFTNDQPAINIGLTGSDPEGQALTFAKASDPVFGSASVVGDTATYTPADRFANVEDSFTYTATDVCGLVSAPATIGINSPGDPTIPPDDPVETVVATDQLCARDNEGQLVVPIDCPVQTIKDTAVTLTLRGTAPCDPAPLENPPNPALPCDGVGNDTPLTFSVPSMTSAEGSLTNLAPGTGTPVRTATVLYTPPAGGFTGVDSFTFEVEGDVQYPTSIGIVSDTGYVDVSVEAFVPPARVEATDQRVSTPEDTPVLINLSGGKQGQEEQTCSVDGDCREGYICVIDQGEIEGICELSPAPLTSGATASQTSAASAGDVTDDTGSADVPAVPARRSGVSIGSASRAALPDEELYGIDSDLDQLFEIHPLTALSTLVGSTAAGPTTPASLAFDGINMYTIDLGGGGLYVLNLNTGAPTLVCSTGIGGWQGVASDPTDEGQFYGITQSDDLYKIDRTTCTTTRVNATAGTVGGLIAALEFDANGTLWGAEFGSSGSTTENAALVTIDKTTGAVTVVSQCATRPCTGSDNFADGFQGIDFATDGTLYGQNTNDDSLYIIDTTDGSLTFIGSNATIFVKGLAFSEEVLLEAGFTILTLPAFGTLSYVDPLTGASTDITAGDLPLLLPTEQVVYTPPEGASGDPLASFTYQQSDGLTIDTGTIDLVVAGVLGTPDECAAVGRPPDCTLPTPSAGEEGGGAPASSSTDTTGTASSGSSTGSSSTGTGATGSSTGSDQEQDGEDVVSDRHVHGVVNQPVTFDLGL